MNLPIRIGSGILAAVGAFIETTWPMRDKPRVAPGLEGVAAWPDGEHALVEAEAERDVSEPTECVDGTVGPGQQWKLPEGYFSGLSTSVGGHVGAAIAGAVADGTFHSGGQTLLEGIRNLLNAPAAPVADADAATEGRPAPKASLGLGAGQPDRLCGNDPSGSGVYSCAKPLGHGGWHGFDHPTK